MYLNARSVVKRGALDSLKLYCEVEGISCVLISESWLKAHVTDSELSLGGLYQTFRRDRHTRGGGVLLLVAKWINVIQIRFDYDCEFLAVEIVSPDQCFRVACFYATNSGEAVER